MNKPHVLDDYDNAPLSAILRCYPFFVQNPRAWLAGRSLTPDECRQYPAIARALGYALTDASRPHTHKRWEQTA